MHPFDHVFFLLLLIGLPAYSAWSWRHWLARLAAGLRPRRLRLYLGSMAQLWGLLILLAAAWYWLDRPVDWLGLRAPGGSGFWPGLALVCIATLAFLYSWRAMRAAGESERRRYRREVGALGHIMPRDGREYGVFVALSLTAGIVEETIFRGWLIWYLEGLLPMWAAVLLSSVVFGLAHLYQGPVGIVKTSVVGLAMALLYLLSGSLWLPIAAHAMIDILQGATMLELYRRRAGPGSGHEEDGRLIP
jgi:membrane protease YdiL (CAAX protease family)